MKYIIWLRNSIWLSIVLSLSMPAPQLHAHWLDALWPAASTIFEKVSNHILHGNGPSLAKKIALIAGISLTSWLIYKKWPSHTNSHQNQPNDQQEMQIFEPPEIPQEDEVDNLPQENFCQFTSDSDGELICADELTDDSTKDSGSKYKSTTTSSDDEQEKPHKLTLGKGHGISGANDHEDSLINNENLKIQEESNPQESHPELKQESSSPNHEPLLKDLSHEGTDLETTSDYEREQWEQTEIENSWTDNDSSTSQHTQASSEELGTTQELTDDEISKDSHEDHYGSNSFSDDEQDVFYEESEDYANISDSQENFFDREESFWESDDSSNFHYIVEVEEKNQKLNVPVVNELLNQIYEKIKYPECKSTLLLQLKQHGINVTINNAPETPQLKCDASNVQILINTLLKYATLDIEDPFSWFHYRKKMCQYIIQAAINMDNDLIMQCTFHELPEMFEKYGIKGIDQAKEHDKRNILQYYFVYHEKLFMEKDPDRTLLQRITNRSY